MRSLHLIKENRYGGLAKIYCLVGNEVVFEQDTVLNWQPV